MAAYTRGEKSNSKIIYLSAEDKTGRDLAHGISVNTVNDYLTGRTAIPLNVFISLCQLFDVSTDSFISSIYEEIGVGYTAIPPEEPTLEKAFGSFANIMFGQRNDNRYVFDTTKQDDLFSLLFPVGERELKLHFTYLPINLRLTSKKDNKAVLYQRGELTFVKKNGMCHVTSSLEISSQGTPTKYDGFAIIMNPSSTGPTCTCFVREVNNDFGIIILFTFRLSPKGGKPKKTRMSECMSVRLADGTSFIYRLLISENMINDDMMKYFVSHLKLNTSENTIEGKELLTLVSEKYINIAEKYFNNMSSEDDDEATMYVELDTYFTGVDKQKCTSFINEIKRDTSLRTDSIYRINPFLMNSLDKDKHLILSWLGKYGLSARHDKIPLLLDDAVENIHKELYPELHSRDNELW